MARKYGKRQRFGDRYVARNAKGEFISNVNVGRSLKQDRARKAKDQDERSGFGQMGDERRAEYEAQGYNAKLDESLGMSRKESMMRQSRKARRDESKGTEKYDGSRAYSRVRTMDMSAENLAVADVDIHDGMVLPEGTGSIIGQAIPETDFTPFGVSAEGYDDKLDESLGMSHKESKMKQSLKARRDESKGMKKASGKRAYSRVGTMDKNADYFENAAGGFYPTGDGRAFGSMTLDNTYAPLAAAEGDITSGFKMGMGATLGVIGGLAFAGWVGGMMSSLSDKKDE